MSYAAREDLELVFGAVNIGVWADLDNQGVAEDIAARITWALEQADAMIDDRLRGGPYDIPFADGEVPKQIVTAACRLAAATLYDARGVSDQDQEGNPVNRLAPHRDMAMKLLNDVLAGKVKLDGLSTYATYPAVFDGRDP